MFEGQVTLGNARYFSATRKTYSPYFASHLFAAHVHFFTMDGLPHAATIRLTESPHPVTLLTYVRLCTVEQGRATLLEQGKQNEFHLRRLGYFDRQTIDGQNKKVFRMFPRIVLSAFDQFCRIVPVTNRQDIAKPHDRWGHYLRSNGTFGLGQFCKSME